MPLATKVGKIDFQFWNLKMGEAFKVSSQQLNLFDVLSCKISTLVYSRTDGHKKLLHEILDALNSLDYHLFTIKKEKGMLLINQCCYLIPTNENSLVIKAVNLFTSMITKGLLYVEGKTLSVAVNWCKECLKFGNEINILKCIQALIKGNIKNVEEQNLQILNDLEKVSNDFAFISGTEELCLNCLKCIEALTVSPETKNDVLPLESILPYFLKLKDFLFKGKNIVVQNEIVFSKALITAMRGVGNLIEMSIEVISAYLGDILGIIKGYMLFGFCYDEFYKIQKIYPTSATVPEVLKSSSQNLKKLRGKYDKKSKKVTISSINDVEQIDWKCTNEYIGCLENNSNELGSMACKTSDSDFSDSEYTHGTLIKSFKGKVRHCSLILLGKVLGKTDPKIFIGYIPSFLQDNSKFLHMRTLITCLLEDPSPKCKSEVLSVLFMIISNSRQYFLQADGISKSPFISFSYTISNIINELHKCLLLNLKTEKNNVVIKRNLKCISELIRCTPFHKMRNGLVSEIADTVKSFLYHKDVNVQIFALTVFGCLVSVEPKIKEVKDLILNLSEKETTKTDSEAKKNSKTDSDFEDFLQQEELESVKKKPWLFELCVETLNNANKNSDLPVNAALQIESLQVFGALVRNFFIEILVSFPKEIMQLLENGIKKNEYSLRLYSGKIMETVLNSLQFSFSLEDESKRAPISLATYIWETLLPGPIITLIQSEEEPMLRSTGCDCIANIGIQTQNRLSSPAQSSLIFDQLPKEKQILCVTILFGCVKDESFAVRNSAIRALAIFVHFLSLREDSFFCLDVINVTLVAAKDCHITVKTQASWLLGNLSEAIVLNKQHNIEDEITLDLIAQLMKTGITLAGDNPKTKPGAVRAIGNLLQIMDEIFLKSYKEIVGESIEILIKNATTGTFMKARWNSCYAIANMLKNPLIHSNLEWVSKIIKVVITLTQHYKNFKVRISAGQVLCAIPNRESFGGLYNEVWSAVLNGLENSKNIADFNEYQHRDQLVDQLCLAVCHLVSVINASDLLSLQDILYFQLDNLSYFMEKFQERVVPEKSSVLLNAASKVQSLMNDKLLSSEEKSLLKVLKTLLVNFN